MLLGVLKEARRQGHTPEAIFGSETGDASWLEDFEREGIPVTLGPRTSSRLRLGKWLDEYLGDDPDPVVLHTHFTSWDVPALIAARGRDAAVFWHVHSALPRNPFVVARTALKFGVLGRGAAGLLCPAPNIVDGARRRLAPRARTHFIPSSLDLEWFTPRNAEERERARTELGLPPDAKVLLHFGWHWHLKGSDVFLDVLRQLAASDPRVIGVDRGGGDEMVARAAELGISEHFRVIPPVDDVRTIHGAADVMISSSREEGMAYAVLESLACGTPVVATAIPGHAVIGNEIDACRLTALDVDELCAATLETLERSEEEAEREAHEAYAWMSENLAHEPVAKRVIDLYENALPPGPEPRKRPRAKGEVRLIQLCNFANEQPGSFVPMVAAAVEHARSVGWEAEAIFSEAAERHEWHAELMDQGIVRRTAPGGTRTEVSRWARSLAGEQGLPAIVHTHFTRYDLPMALSARRGRIAVVWHEHTALSSHPTIVMRNAIKFGVGARRVAAILCPAPDLAEAVAKRGAPAGRVRFVPNAIDASHFPPIDAARRADARRHLGIGEDALVALSFGWHWDLKGGELFQRTIAHVTRRSDRSVVALHSTQAPEAPILRSALRMESVIRLLEQTSDVVGLMAAADVFVAASRAEGGTPLAVLEALSSGLPVVASDLPSHRFVSERVPGMALVEREPERMAAAVVDASTVPGRLDGPSGQASHEAVEREFSLSHWCSEVFETYERIASGLYAGRLY